MIWVFAFVFALLSCIMDAVYGITYPTYDVTLYMKENRTTNSFSRDRWWWWRDDEMNKTIYLAANFIEQLYFAKTLPTHRQTRKNMCDEREKSQNSCVFIFSSLNISLFSYSFVSFRFRNCVCHPIFRLRWWRITLTNQIYIQKPNLSFSLDSIAAGPSVSVGEKSVTIRCCCLFGVSLAHMLDRSKFGSKSKNSFLIHTFTHGLVNGNTIYFPIRQLSSAVLFYVVKFTGISINRLHHP